MKKVFLQTFLHIHTRVSFVFIVFELQLKIFSSKISYIKYKYANHLDRGRQLIRKRQ